MKMEVTETVWLTDDGLAAIGSPDGDFIIGPCTVSLPNGGLVFPGVITKVHVASETALFLSDIHLLPVGSVVEQ